MLVQNYDFVRMILQGIINNDKQFRFIHNVLNLKQKPSVQQNCRHKGYTKRITIITPPGKTTCIIGLSEHDPHPN